MKRISHELLTDLAVHVSLLLTRRGIQEDEAQAIGDEVADYIRRHWGGQQIYFPKEFSHRVSRIHRQLLKFHHQGATVEQLARRFRLSSSHIYRLLKQMKKDPNTDFGQ